MTSSELKATRKVSAEAVSCPAETMWKHRREKIASKENIIVLPLPEPQAVFQALMQAWILLAAIAIVTDIRAGRAFRRFAIAAVVLCAEGRKQSVVHETRQRTIGR